MMNIRIIAFIVFAFMTWDASALPKAFQASYTVSKGVLNIGVMNTSLAYKGDTYSYNKSSKAKGLASFLSGDKIIENVSGKFKGNFLQSGSYFFHHKSKRKDRKETIKFSSPVLVLGSYEGDAYKTPIKAGTMDRATMELALARDMMAKKKVLKYSVVEKGKEKEYTLRRLGSETLTIGGKKYVCDKVIVARNNSKRKTISWLAKELDYLPVQIKHIEKGTSIMTKLKSFRFTAKK